MLITNFDDKGNINYFLKGQELFGDNFSEEELKKWFEEEKNAYSDLHVDGANYCYSYHAVDNLYGYKFIDDINLNILGIGSANGAEFQPIADKINKITIIENSDKYQNMLVDNLRIEFLKANFKGVIESPNDTYDIVVCFSVLHHIANVSFVMAEIARVLRKNGLALIREPIISMGDWRFPRRGLTKNERGIPITLFRTIIKQSGLSIISEKIWNFPPLSKLLFFYKKPLFNNIFLTYLDGLLSDLFKWNSHYFPKIFFHKIAPASIYFVLKKYY